ncbi:SfnB family sulfur acquisition oxidoreductase [Rhodococcus erythropolis]|uniref:SfnB family sulfur acquisition oxidoreductase n=1 Tax=Rhodococcus erythropolis TaxID=1833 RepID=UPI00038DC53C|nr:SfnB family sulfur acquisition oxidoreductase [Rhodococcus erythropolis]AGT95073.1 FMNH2-dependent monooxygenase [Rhodococcus erythropolis CCM2595]MDJ0011998.1 SfnB family sulfur acquisition oxidoreductase [Rhodococcus erythropolis]ORI25941.1 SfnB family sulfur acquisition oxidoreductase [Rhodococcus erythropolis]SUE10559.1 FMNH2-dependent monooxygenase [Rhodococcus erythropolis]
MTAVDIQEIAHRITSEDEALSVASQLSDEFAAGAGVRDAQRLLPHDEVRTLAQSGLLGLSVPKEFGGIDASTETLAEVFRLLAEGDPSIAQIPHSHFTFLEALRYQGSNEQKQFFYAEALSGKQFANAQSERGNKTIDIDGTTLTPDGEDFVLEGRKFYCTGALFADWIVVRAANADQFTETGAQVKSAVYLPRSTPGLSIVDDWDGMGQKTTASGTVTLESVSVPRFNVVPFTSLFTHPTTYGAQAQILHAAIDTGIASAALRESVKLAAKARPFFEAKVDTAVEDPLLVQLAGEAAIEVRAARSLLAEAARSIDVARFNPTEDSTARASIDAATAKVVGARASLAATSTLFEIGGTRSAGESANLSRFWRDARTHTLHDPTRWKVQHIGRWTLSGTIPPRHGLL